MLQLTGSFAGAQLAATARHLIPNDYRLLARKFRWVEDF
jgi:hypothetical protein